MEKLRPNETRVTTWLSIRTHRTIKRVAAVNHSSVRNVVQFAISEYLKAAEANPRAWAGLPKDGRLADAN